MKVKTNDGVDKKGESTRPISFHSSRQRFIYGADIFTTENWPTYKTRVVRFS